MLPTSGRVEVDGRCTRRHGAKVRKRVGFVFTDPDAQVVMPTVAEDIALGLRRRGLDRDEIDRRVQDTLRRYDLSDHADHPAHLLSGGQKQLLALASVLATEPRILVCDEPTTLLDLRNARRVLQTLLSLPQQVILVTHHLELLQTFDRVLVFDDGRLVVDAPPEAAVKAYRESVC